MEGAQHMNDYTLGSSPSSSSSIKVFVRSRPPSSSFSRSSSSFKLLESNKVQISDSTGERGNHEHVFGYERVFGEDSNQSDLYAACCEPHVAHLMDGFNSCVFAYGQTGSGKTYSMFGESGEERGVIPRCVESIIGEAGQKRKGGMEVAVVVSFLEIYCDQIRDLGSAFLASASSSGDKVGDLAPSSSGGLSGLKTSEIFTRLQLDRQSSFSRPSTLSRSASRAPTDTSNDGDNASNASSSTNLRKEQEDGDYKSMHYEIHEDNDKNVFVKVSLGDFSLSLLLVCCCWCCWCCCFLFPSLSFLFHFSVISL